MIIAFYPGSGGNRYYQYYLGLREFVPRKIYDLLVNQSPFYRYIDRDSNLPNKELILTHCVNVPLLKKKFPGHEIIVIVADLDSSLRREWLIAGSERNKKKGLEIDKESAYATISYHYKYYAEYPLDTTGATTIIDLNDNSDFSKMMLNEINSFDSEIFNNTLIEYKKINPHQLDKLPVNKVSDGYKSKFLDDAEVMKQQLDKISPSMCLAKWKQVSLHLATGMNNSCYHPPLHRIEISDISRGPQGLHNTAYKKEQRKKMLAGERPQECSYCWTQEDLGNLSDRHYRSGEPWAAMDFGKIVSGKWDADIVPSYVEVNFNHACNLSCSYCSPQFSSTWQAEVEKFGGYPTSTTHNDPSHFTGNRRPIPAREHNPYVDAFWEWWPELYPKLKHFRMTGGEPLLDKNTYRVFDYVLALPNPDLHLNVTSNFSVENKLFDQYIDYVKRLCNTQIEHFMQYVSLDTGIASHAEYIRHGLDFNRALFHCVRYLQEVPNRNSLTFIITMNNLNVLGLQKLLEVILNLRRQYSTTYQRVWFDTPLLRQPLWQSLQILPAAYADILERVADWMELNLETPEDPFHGFKDYEVQRLRRDIDWMREGQKLSVEYKNKQQADFYRFFSEHDRRRGTNFIETFPEMTSWWRECEYYARTL